MNDLQRIIHLAEHRSFDHLFKSGTLELPKNPRSQQAGALYDFINFKNGFYEPVYRTFEAFKDSLLSDIPIPTGELALRLVRYKTREPFYPHIDVSYKSVTIASANTSEDILLLPNTVIYGRQAKELSDKHAKFHHFNQNGMKYYLGIFASARGDLKLSCGLTIDEYMQQQYYYSNTF
ncbi:MAG: hypothetical protein ACRDBG_13420 [Waterburya sp.]